MTDRLSICDGIKLMITITDRGKGEKVTDICKKNSINFHLICLGNGTANSDILEYLGLGDTDKDIVMSAVPEDSVSFIIKELSKKMQFDKPGNGIVFTIPINSVGGVVTLQLLTGLMNQEG